MVSPVTGSRRADDLPGMSRVRARTETMPGCPMSATTVCSIALIPDRWFSLRWPTDDFLLRERRSDRQARRLAGVLLYASSLCQTCFLFIPPRCLSSLPLWHFREGFQGPFSHPRPALFMLFIQREKHTCPTTFRHQPRHGPNVQMAWSFVNASLAQARAMSCVPDWLASLDYLGMQV
ncbi:hypothetical protein EDB81DRAFT_165943 [Dactylonectria macrodidyma]|uniref:Uncharacterized protein n=1 Tax=Dactylonectria macrodidyma TaxID=307937 RepID=A0A9P9FPX2_9HYPO|nr:hypothetical protein EDB81DRAFT_165943 [Dactylonectria macrodidyma]